MRFENVAVLAGALMLGAVATDAAAQRKDGWVELGCQTVSFGVDRDVLRVGNQEGRFKAIRLHARGAGIEVLDMKVVYGNNEIEDVRVRRVLRRGERTRPVDLRGWERAITQVELFYRSLRDFRGREALVCLEGLPGRVAASAAPGRWVDLGCKSVSFKVDRDIVKVARREGRFGAIRVHARGGDVEMLDLKVVYGNGSVDDIQVRQVMKRGSRTRTIDLKGARERTIDRIEMIYRAVPNYKGREALVCIEGLQ